jgi:SAM-dependent methyltransferase
MVVDLTLLKKIDLGCGPNKKEGCLGIDYQKFETVDFILDVTKDRLPFEDNSVGYIHSAHFFEHIKVPNFVFSEISRVAVDGASLEIWTPYAYSDGAFCYGHEIFFTEEHWQHICVKFPEFYLPIINARWLLKKIVYVIDPNVFTDIKKHGFDIEFAIKYFKGIVTEIGVFIEIRHDLTVKNCIPKKYYSFQREGEFVSFE